MRVLFAVIQDLWDFCRGLLFGGTTQPSVIPTVPTKLLPPVALPLLLHEDVTPVRTLLPATVANVLLPEPGQEIASQYVSVEMALLHTEPVIAFDNVRSRLLYGTPVAVSKRSGRWTQVVSQTHEFGWILSEQLEPASKVFPQFSLGKTYDAVDQQTIKLRHCIDDQFQAGASVLPLGGGEYVTYRLWQAGRVIAWPASYGRVLGTWHRKLRGVRGIHLDVMPRTGSVMEYIVDEVGYVAFIESVTPDLRIKIAAVGLTFEGQYSEQAMSHEDWRELHPVFIRVL